MAKRNFVIDGEIPMIASTFKTRTEFSKKSSGAYKRATQLGILDEVCDHMKPLWEKKWNMRTVKTEALKYTTRTDFMRNSGGAYNASIRFGIRDNVCTHMGIKIIRWTDAMMRDLALQYTTRSSFKNENQSAYAIAINRGILNEICSHMEVALSGFDVSKPAILYYLSIDNGTAYKIGITNRTVEERYRKCDLHRMQILNIKDYYDGQQAKKAERDILDRFKYAKYKGDKLLLDGHSEMFDRDVLGLDYGNA